MLSAANENVLMTVDFLSLDRLPTDISTITHYTNPDLSIDEVRIIVDLLCRDRNLDSRDIDGPVWYSLTDIGRSESGRIIERTINAN